MRQIRKYPLVQAHDSLTQITLPKDAWPLCVREQYGHLCVWFEVDTEEAREETVALRVIGTGHPFEHGKEKEDFNLYVGTAQVGPYVWHVYVLRFEEITQ